MKHLGIFMIGCILLSSCAGQQPGNLGLHNGRLADCPSKPNCVSSQTGDKDHKISPFHYDGEKEGAINRLKKIIESIERTTLITETDNYLHVEFTSEMMGFVDDIEFFFPKEKLIHIRSASRIGYSDFGANRKRLEHLRMLFSIIEKNSD